MTSPDLRFKTLAGPRTTEDGPGVQRRQNITTAAQRLHQATKTPFENEDVSFESSASSLTNLRGYDNPYGRGLSAYEPNTILFDDYARAKGAVDASKAKDAAATEAGTTSVDFSVPNYSTGGIVDGSGKVQGLIAAAMDLATRRVPYVWGGTSANGVDCSGMIYYAARAAGIDIPRYRAVDYGRMGTAVDINSARPGDVVYFDNSGDTDHVGIYIGNGQMIQAPQTGDVVKVSNVGNFTSIRRIFDDSAFLASPTANGGAQPAYSTGGRTAPVSVRGVLAPVGAAPTALPTSIKRTGTSGGFRAA